MEMELYLEASPIRPDASDVGSIGACVLAHHPLLGFPDLRKADLAIVGVGESRLSHENEACDRAPDIAREAFYALRQGNFKARIVDCGNLRRGHQPSDTFAALTTILVELLEFGILPIVIGGSQDLTFAIYKAYEKRKQIINLLSIDSRLDIGDPEGKLKADTYLSHMMVGRPNYLFTYMNLGQQNYLVDQSSLRLMETLNFESLRLGQLHANIEEAEPFLRYADVISVDFSAIRHCDSPGHPHSMPVGLSGEQICQLLRYAGISEKTSCLGLFEYNPVLDPNNQSGKLMGLLLWCFVEAFYQRKHEYPHRSKDGLTTFTVAADETAQDLVFYKSRLTNRWWMEIPCNADQQHQYQTHYLVPCSYNDYLQAMQNELPERWLTAFARFNA